MSDEQRPEKHKDLLDSSSSDDDSSSVDSSDDDQDDDSNNKANGEKKEEEEYVGLKINRKYAKEYNARKRREELTKYTKEIRRKKKSSVSFASGSDGVGSDEGDSSSSEDSSDESEDERGDLLTPALDLKIMQTINALRRGDERVYDPKVRFFPEEEDSPSSPDGDVSTEATSKPKRIKDVLREQILKQMDDEDNDAENGDSGGSSSDEERKTGINASASAAAHYGDRPVHHLAYDEEQRQIRSEFLDSVKEANDIVSREQGSTKKTQEGSDSDDEDRGLLVMKKKRSSGDEGAVAATELAIQKEIEEMEQAQVKTQPVAGGDDALGAAAATYAGRLPVKSVVVDPRDEVKDGEKFLRDFMLNRRWVDKSDFEEDFTDDDDEGDSGSGTGGRASKINDSGPLVGSYDDRNDAQDKDGEDGDTSSLEDLDRMDAFESKYNFRFEEAAAESNEDRYQIVGYARGSAADSLRRKDDTRAQKRLARKERKLGKRKATEEQLRRLKNARREDMRKKLEQIRSVSGVVNAPEGAKLSEETLAKLLEGDFDPEKYAEIMENDLYGEEGFYQKEDEQWKSDKDVTEALINGEGGENGEEYGDAYDYDEDYGENEQNEENIEEQESGDQEEEDYDFDDQGNDEQDNWVVNRDGTEGAGSEIEKQIEAKMVDELYKLDYEDLIGDMPCRFKYRQVEPNSYGLSCEEILFAKDSTLKQFVSLKKMAPYREEEEHRVGSKKRKRFRQMLKQDYETFANDAEEGNSNPTGAGQKSIGSGYVGENVDSGQSAKKKKRRRQKKGKKQARESSATLDRTEKDDEKVNDACNTNPGEDGGGDDPGVPEKDRGQGKRKRKKKGKKKIPGADGADVGDEAVVVGAQDRGYAPTTQRPEKSMDTTVKVADIQNKTGPGDKKRKRKKAGKKQKGLLPGVSASRLASYGL